MQLVVDPLLLRLGRDENAAEWGARLDQISSLLDSSPLSGSCPKTLADAAMAHLFEEEHKEHSGFLTVGDLIRVLHEITGRLSDDVVTPEGTAMIDDVALDPPYVALKANSEALSVFEAHLGSAAWAKATSEPLVIVLSPSSSWARVEEAIRVDGQVILQDHPLYGERETDETVHAFLPRVDSPDGILLHLSHHPCALLEHLQLGVRAVWCTKFGGSPNDLSFEIGPDFADSLRRLDYARDQRYAGACLRTMALVGAGKAENVPGHAERVGDGPNDAVQEDSRGFPIQRGYLAQKTSDAHRIWWARSPVPRFLGVGRHDDKPHK